MDYFAFHFSTDPGLEEALLGLLSGFPIESFEEPESGRLVAYMPASVPLEKLKPELDRLNELIPFELRIERIQAQNWNEVWESNFPPIQVGNFCGIRAEFHPPLRRLGAARTLHPAQDGFWNGTSRNHFHDDRDHGRASAQK
ncbi:MAG: hypothetical protein WA004_15710 [Saprospiraceae bacterium]